MNLNTLIALNDFRTYLNTLNENAKNYIVNNFVDLIYNADNLNESVSIDIFDSGNHVTDDPLKSRVSDPRSNLIKQELANARSQEQRLFKAKQLLNQKLKNIKTNLLQGTCNKLRIPFTNDINLLTDNQRQILNDYLNNFKSKLIIIPKDTSKEDRLNVLHLDSIRDKFNDIELSSDPNLRRLEIKNLLRLSRDSKTPTEIDQKLQQQNYKYNIYNGSRLKALNKIKQLKDRIKQHRLDIENTRIE